MNNEKPITWVDSALKDLLKFPDKAKRETGFQLHRIQYGEDPDNWKPFNQIGAGVREIRISEDNGIYRVMYVAKFEEAVYVLHAFQKTSQTTTKHDKDIASARYQRVLNWRRQHGH
ncbi:type II toxin-antitoxin system RelE/ParE family toxin [Candidatus Venteria ishoeyi]|uniref:type II toxin-antitoxin system RelE/ParE family toxin n=1 Tax=Candidatus Venteria ishoeyi TaxID=1899563 RepID=UPI0025A4E893|nr:type II toxin-antitoxin system RelE/ParE family toxin [Candidatus Venteria ishoeyi]MDM8546294.1 type II toxin-antitoxin system RelE/ParE family toxin [Candidatus Venteria ishoeyi]